MPTDSSNTDTSISPAEPARPGTHVLVADDEADIRLLISEALAHLGYTTRTASNGQQAIEELAAYPPGLLFLDLHMPVLNGWAVLEHLRETNNTIPVVVVTADERARRQLVAQSIPYLYKPFSIDALFTITKKYFTPPLPDTFR